MSDMPVTPISGPFLLPSGGKIYSEEVNPSGEIRSMTTQEELRRLSSSSTFNKKMSEIIDDCTNHSIGISSYDLHVGDFEYLVYRLRVATYGPIYPTAVVCNHCNKINRINMSLDKDLEIMEPDEHWEELLKLRLPNAGNVITLRFTTPRDEDEIEREVQDYNETHVDSTIDPTLLIRMKHQITAVDGEHWGTLRLDSWLRNLLAIDAHAIRMRMNRINRQEVGVSTLVSGKCSNPKCGSFYHNSFQLSGDIFFPSMDQ